MLNKKLVGPLKALWQEFVSVGNDGRGNTSSIESDLDGILEILAPIEFDNIDENSRNLYPAISVDLLKVVIVYYRCLSAETQSKHGDLIGKVWAFCYRIMTIQDSNSIASYERYIAFLLSTLPELLKCLYVDGFDVLREQDVVAMRFISQYVQLMTRLLGYSASDKKWFLLFLETNLEACIGAYNLLLNAAHCEDSPTAVRLVHAVDEGLAACILDSKAVEEIAQLSVSSVHTTVAVHVTRLMSGGVVPAAAAESTPTGKKSQKRVSKGDAASSQNAHATSYYMTIYSALASALLGQHGAPRCVGDVTAGVGRFMVLYGIKSLRLSQQQASGAGALSLFNATRRHYARVLHLACCMTACMAAISAAKAGTVAPIAAPAVVSAKRHKGSGGGTAGGKANVGPSAQVFAFVVSADSVDLAIFLLKYRNVCLHTVITALQHQTQSQTQVGSASLAVASPVDLAATLAGYSPARMAALPNHEQIHAYVDTLRGLMRGSVAMISSHGGECIVTAELVCMQILVLIDHRALFVNNASVGDSAKAAVSAINDAPVAPATPTTLLGEVFASVCSAGSASEQVLPAAAAAGAFVQLVARLFSKLRMMDVLLREVTGPGSSSAPSGLLCLVQLMQEPATQAVFMQEYAGMFRGQIRALWEILVDADGGVVMGEGAALRRHLRLVMLRPLAHTLQRSVLDAVNFSVHSNIDAHLIAHSAKRQQLLMQSKHFFNGGKVVAEEAGTSEDSDGAEDVDIDVDSDASDAEMDEDSVPTNAGAGNAGEADLTGEGAALLLSQAASADKSYPDYLPPLQCVAGAVRLAVGQLEWCEQELSGAVAARGDPFVSQRLVGVAALVETNAAALSDLCLVCTKLLMYSHPVSGSSQDVRWLETLLGALHEARKGGSKGKTVLAVDDLRTRLEGCEAGVWAEVFQPLLFRDQAGVAVPTDSLLATIRSSVRELACPSVSSIGASKSTPKNTPKKKRSRSDSSTPDTAQGVSESVLSAAGAKAVVGVSCASFSIVHCVVNCLAVVSIARGCSAFSGDHGTPAVAACQQICNGVFSDCDSLIRGWAVGAGTERRVGMSACFAMLLEQADVWAAVLPPAAPGTVVPVVFQTIITSLLTLPTPEGGSAVAAEAVLRPLACIDASRDYTLLVVSTLLDALDALMAGASPGAMLPLLHNLRCTLQFVLHHSARGCRSELLGRCGRLLKTHVVGAVLVPFFGGALCAPGVVAVCADIAIIYMRHASLSGIKGDADVWTLGRLAQTILGDPAGVQSMWVRCGGLFASVAAARKAAVAADTTADSVTTLALLLLDTLFNPCEQEDTDSTDDIDGNDFCAGVQHTCEFVGHIAASIAPAEGKGKSRGVLVDAELAVYCEAVRVAVGGVHRLSARARSASGPAARGAVAAAPIVACIKAALGAMSDGSGSAASAHRADCCLLLCVESVRMLNCLTVHGLVSGSVPQLALSFWLEQHLSLVEVPVATVAPRWVQLFGCLLMVSGPGSVAQDELAKICSIAAAVARSPSAAVPNMEECRAYSTVLLRAVASRVPLGQWLLRDCGGATGNVYCALVGDLSRSNSNSSSTVASLAAAALEVLLQYAVSLLRESAGSSRRCKTGGYAEAALNIARYCSSQLPALLLEGSIDVALASQVRDALRSLCVEVRAVLEVMAASNGGWKRGARAAKTSAAETLRKAQDKCVAALLQCCMSSLTALILQIGNEEGAEARAAGAVACSGLLVIVWNTFSSSALWENGLSSVIWVLKVLMKHVLNYSEGLGADAAQDGEAGSEQQREAQRQKQLRCEAHLRSIATCIISVSGNAAAVRKEPQLAKNFPMIATCLIDALVGYSLPPFVKEIIFPSIFTLFDKFQPNPAKQRMIVHNNLTAEGKVVLAEMQEVYSREYKYSGQV